MSDGVRGAINPSFLLREFTGAEFYCNKAAIQQPLTLGDSLAVHTEQESAADEKQVNLSLMGRWKTA